MPVGLRLWDLTSDACRHTHPRVSGGVRHCCLEVWPSNQIHIHVGSLICELWLGRGSLTFYHSWGKKNSQYQVALVWVEKKKAAHGNPQSPCWQKEYLPVTLSCTRPNGPSRSTAPSSAGPRPRGGTGQEFPTQTSEYRLGWLHQASSGLLLLCPPPSSPPFLLFICILVTPC